MEKFYNFLMVLHIVKTRCQFTCSLVIPPIGYLRTILISGWKNFLLLVIHILQSRFLQKHVPLWNSLNIFIHFTCQVPAHLSDFHPFDLPLPNDVCQIVSGPNYDYCSSTMRFTISSPVVCIFICCFS